MVVFELLEDSFVFSCLYNKKYELTCFLIPSLGFLFFPHMSRGCREWLQQNDGCQVFSRPLVHTHACTLYCLVLYLVSYLFLSLELYVLQKLKNKFSEFTQTATAATTTATRTKRKLFMSTTIALHVGFTVLYISHPSSTKEHHEIIKFRGFWENVSHS